MSFLNRYSFSVVVAVLFLPVIYPTRSDAEPFVIASSVVDLLTKSANLNASPPPSYATSRRSAKISEPILLPNLFIDDKEAVATLQRLDAVPESTDATLKVIKLGNSPVNELLGRLKGDVVVSTQPLTSRENALFLEAKSILFKRNGLPTEEYAKYLKYEVEYEAELEKLKAEADPVQQRQKRLSLTQLEREWGALADRATIASAVKQYENFNKDRSSSRFDSWLALLKPVDIAAALSFSLGSSDWVRLSYSSAPSRGSLQIEVGGRSIDLGPVKRLSFDATLCWIERPYLRTSFLLDKAWKSKSGKVISDGTAGTAADELVPALITGAILSKNIEIQLSNDLNSDAIEIFRQGKTFKLGGFQIRFGIDAFGFQQRQIVVSGPVVVGAVVDELRKSPDPLPEVRWAN